MTDITAPKLPLIARIATGEVGTLELIKIKVVPGEVAMRVFTILLIVPLCHEPERRWLGMMQRIGYGGTTVIVTPNFPSAEDIIESGQISAIVMWDADFTKKRYMVDEAQSQTATKGVAKVGLFVFEDPFHVGWAERRLREFLAQHCPLS